METIAYTIAGVTTEVIWDALGIVAGTTGRVTFGTHGSSKMSFTLNDMPPETAPVIPFEVQCVVYANRSAIGVGGVILFQGRRIDNSGEAAGETAVSTLVIEDAWYDLRNITLQAVWQIITGYSGSTPTYGTASWPDAVLFQATPGATYMPAAVISHITTGQAIVEILTYAISLGVRLQIGEIDPSLYVPFYPIRCERCDQAIKYALRVHPDCTTEIDYTTAIPTFNIRKQSNLSPVYFPYAGSSTVGGVTQTHLTSSIKPRPDLIPTRVGIYLKSIGQIGSKPTVAIGTDIYPPTAPSGLRSFDTSIDMSGPRYALVTGQVTSTAVAFNTLPWWKLKVPELNQPEIVAASLGLLNTNINDGSKSCITVVDESGNPIDLTVWPYVLEHEGTVHPWMTLGNVTGGTPVQTIKAIVTAHFTYQQQKNTNTSGMPVWTNIGKPNDHAKPIRVHLTNSPAGTQGYEASQLTGTGETYPGGLAQGIFTALQTLQYQFDHTILEQPFATIVKPGKHALNVVGSNLAWAAMNAMIQETVIDFTYSADTGITTAKTTMRCGPVAHLEPGQLIQLFNIFQNRDINKINFNERSTGVPNGGANAIMPSGTARENSTNGQPDDGLKMFSAVDATDATKTNAILHDPVNGQLVMSQLVNATGAVNPTAPSITLAQADILAAGTVNKAAKFQLVSCCQNDGTVKKFLILATNPE